MEPSHERCDAGVLDEAPEQRRTAKQTELWRLRKCERELRFLGVYTAAGLDLRLFHGERMLRTALCLDASTLRGKADQWRSQLTPTGWLPAK